MKQVIIYTDGACSGNPGPGGWGAVLKYGAHERELSGGEASTTNNRMELTAVIEALDILKEPCVVELYSDSKYVIDGLSKGCAKGCLRLEAARLGQKRQKARAERRFVGAALVPHRPARNALPLGQRPRGE